MRSLVRLCLLIALGASLQVHAQSPPADPGASWDAYKSSIQISDPDISAIFLRMANADFCTASSSYSGCTAATAGTAPTCDDLNTKMAKCCSSTGCPELLNAEAKAAEAATPIIDVGGTSGSGKISAETLTHQTVKYTGYASACNAYKAACFHACSTGATPNETKKNACKPTPLDSNSFIAQAVDANQGVKDSLASKDAGSSMTDQSADTTKDSGSGGDMLGGEGPQILMSLASAVLPMLMKKPDPPTPLPAPDCSNPGLVAAPGVCPVQSVNTPPASDSWNKAQGNIGTASAQDYAGPIAPQMPGIDPQVAPDAQTFSKSGSADVVNNGGGPMAQGAPSANGALGAAGAAKAGGSSAAANVLKGEWSGGYSAGQGGDASAGGGGGGGWSGYGREPASDPSLDLSAFLPGGRNDPNRKVTGLSAQSSQINSKEVNIWARISDHIRTRCSQGLLRDCIP